MSTKMRDGSAGPAMGAVGTKTILVKPCSVECAKGLALSIHDMRLEGVPFKGSEDARRRCSGMVNRWLE